jgi:GR25 family glycosyltransferase involved in LPS biosynthesis
MVALVIINLDRRSDRLKSLECHLHENKFDFIEEIERVSGVTTLENGKSSNHNFTPAKGCMLSHRNAILLAKTKGWKHVMVIEDDARFASNAGVVFQEAMNILSLNNREWSVLFGACVMFQSRGFTQVVSSSTTQLLKLRPNQIITGTHCVVYNSNYYDKIIDLINNEISSQDPYHLDMLLSLNVPHIYLTVPFLALFTENETSDVRIGKNTNIDYQNIVESQKRAIAKFQ